MNAPQRLCSNHVLRLLPEQAYLALASQLEYVSLRARDIVYKQDRAVSYVYFPLSCVLSVVDYLQNGTGVEVTTIANEGMAGTELLLGTHMATDTCICQVAGQSARMRASNFQRHCAGDSALRLESQRYMRIMISQISRNVACNGVHPIEERFARWTLSTSDKVGSQEFHISPEFLGYMLCASRARLNLVISTFEHAGLISYSDGKMVIHDRDKLAATSCECYRFLKIHTQRVLDLERG